MATSYDYSILYKTFSRLIKSRLNLVMIELYGNGKPPEPPFVAFDIVAPKIPTNYLEDDRTFEAVVSFTIYAKTKLQALNYCNQLRAVLGDLASRDIYEDNDIVMVERMQVQGAGLQVEICGLKGGHSGVEIDRQRGNANKLAGRLLCHLGRQQSVYLGGISGGARDNVIPSVSRMMLVVEDPQKAICAMQDMKDAWRKEFASDEPELDIKVTKLGEREYRVFTGESQKKIIGFLVNCPNGVDEYSRSLKGLVETSDNLGVVEEQEHSVRFMVLVRSGVGTKMEELKERLACLAEMAGAVWNVDSEYPAWMYKEHSRIRPITADAFEEVFGARPEVTTIHAGLECGLLSGKKPELDCISFGPKIQDIHSFHERLEIASTQKIWNVLKLILKRCK